MNGQTLAGIFGSIIATIATVLALVFGFSPVATHSIQPGSVNPEPTPTTVEDGVIPSHAVKADAQKAEEILRRGVRGIEYPKQHLSVRDANPDSELAGFPLSVGGSDGCNGFGGSGRINAEGALETANDWRWTMIACGPESGHGAVNVLVRDGMTIYTLGDRVFLKNGDQAMEFRLEEQS